MKFIHLKAGWNSPEFAAKIEKVLEQWKGYIFKDIKVDSKGENCLIIMECIW